MEKRTPHCKLAVVKAMVAAGKVGTTISALAGGAALGFGFEEIIGVVAGLTTRDFFRVAFPLQEPSSPTPDAGGPVVTARGEVKMLPDGFGADSFGLTRLKNFRHVGVPAKAWEHSIRSGCGLIAPSAIIASGTFHLLRRPAY